MNRCLQVKPYQTMPCYLETGHIGPHECYSLHGPADRPPMRWEQEIKDPSQIPHTQNQRQMASSLGIRTASSPVQ